MSYLRDLSGALAFRSGSLHNLAARRSVAPGIACFSAGYLAFVLVRNSSYAAGGGPARMGGVWSVAVILLDIHLIQMLLFLSLVYVPVLVALCNAFSGDGLGFSMSRLEYSEHVSALFPLWGVLFLIGAPILPVFLALGLEGISAGELWLMVSSLVYTVWAVKEINYLPVSAALGVAGISILTLPVLFLLTNFLLSLPFFILLPLLYIFIIRFRELVSAKQAERVFLQHLRSLTQNPRDADAHYQIGLLHFRRNQWEPAQRYFEKALAINPEDPEVKYFLGRVHEARGEWQKALDQYEVTYRLNPEFGLGDIFREVGKGYLNTGNIEKAIEFLQFFLQQRASDPEGRYWLAVALQEAGRPDEMRDQLNTILVQARSNPRFFRKEHRQWIYRARMLLHGASGL